jgi:hypothetical protein
VLLGLQVVQPWGQLLVAALLSERPSVAAQGRSLAACGTKSPGRCGADRRANPLSPTR